jgi:hypothetical protein
MRTAQSTPLVEQIDQTIRQIEPYRDIGIGEHEGRHLRRHMSPPETCGGRHLEMTTGANAAERNRRFGVCQVVENPLAVLEKSLPFESQRQFARRA